MKLENIKNTLTFAVGKSKFLLKKYSPEIFMIGGIALAAGSVITACKSTRKLDEIIEPNNKKLEIIRNKMHDDSAIANGEYSIKDGRKDLAKEYLFIGGKLIKLYAVPAITFTLSVASILTSHRIIKERNLALAALYTGLKNSYDGYRERVKAKLGDKIEEEIYRNLQEEEVVDEKTGEKKTVKKVNSKIFCDMSILFGEGSDGWTNEVSTNLKNLIIKQNYLNMKLRTQGYLFLYDVFKELNIDISMIGKDRLRNSKILGWIYDPNDPTRDSYISFGLTDKDGNYNERAMDYLRNNEPNLWLDFNYDGDILSGDFGKRVFSETATC